MTNVNEGIAERLRRGQANLDRMREDVKQTISLLLGAIELDHAAFFPNEDLKQRLHAPRVIESDGFRWELSWESGSCFIECTRTARDGAFVRKESIYGHSWASAHHMRREDVRLVHRALDVLVSGVMEVSPVIAKVLQSVLDYAD